MKTLRISHILWNTAFLLIITNCTEREWSNPLTPDEDPTNDSRSPIVLEGLIAYYPFNGDANDESGNGHHGNLIGPLLTDDRFGYTNKAFHFDGNDYIEISDDPSFTLGTDPFSLSLWINLDQIGSYFIMGHDDGGGSNRKKWIFWFTGTTLGLHERLSGDYWVINLNWNPNINNWYYLNLIRDGDTFGIYIDSNLLGTIQDTRTFPDPSVPLLIGNAEGSGNMFKGKIDDIRIFNRALSLEEIQALYHENGWDE